MLFGALALLSAGLLLRGALPGTMLFPGTIVACGAIAVMNVLLSSMIKRRAPARAGLLIGVYLTSLSVGAVIASLISVPLYDATGGSVPRDPRACGACRRRRDADLDHPAPLRHRAHPARAQRKDRPCGTRAGVHRHALAWQVTAFMGLQSLPPGSAVGLDAGCRRGPGRALGLAIYFTMARAPDPGTAASLSSLAQSVGYLVAAAGPLAVGFLRAATGGWTVPVTVLLLICGVELAVGLFAGRPKMLPAGGLAASSAGHPEADSTPADNYSKL